MKPRSDTIWIIGASLALAAAGIFEVIDQPSMLVLLVLLISTSAVRRGRCFRSQES